MRKMQRKVKNLFRPDNRCVSSTNIYFKIAVTVLLFVIIFHFINIKDVISVLSKIQAYYIALIILALLILYFLMCLSVWVLLLPVKKIHPWKVIKYQMYSAAIANFTPAQLGESYIAVLLRKEDINFQKALSLFFFNKVINILIVLFAAVPVLGFFDINYYDLYVILCILFIFVPLIVIKTHLRIIIRECVVKKYFMKFYDFFELISDYIKSNITIVILNVIINVLKIFASTMATWLGFLAVGLHVNFFTFLSVWNFARLAGLIPFSLAGWGFVEGTVIFVLARIGFEGSEILGGTIIERFFAVVFAVIIISIYIWGKNENNLLKKDSPQSTRNSHVTNQQLQNKRVYFVIFKTPGIEENTFTSAMSNKVNARFFSIKQKIGRILLNLLLGILPSNLEIFLVSLIKKKASKDVYKLPSSFFIATLVNNKAITIQPEYPDNRQFYIGLTFDIDYNIDYELLSPLVEDLTKNNITATINLITHTDYPLSFSFIRDLQRCGFEIGLHGDTHNTALAFLSRPIITHKLTRAIDKLGFVPFGFRSPGLSYSRNLIEALDDLGFLYDSSLTTGISMYTSLEFPYVFQHQGLGILEVPLFMQDYNYFVNDLFSEKDVIEIFKKQIEDMSKIGGVALINLHPFITSKKQIFWKKLIELMLEYKETAYTSTLYDLVQHIRP